MVPGIQASIALPAGLQFRNGSIMLKKQMPPIKIVTDPMDHLSVTVIDDDDLILEIVRSLLKSIGIQQICTYTSAREALASLDLRDPRSIVICDLNMPEMDGMEVIRHLGQSSFQGAVLILSGEDTRTLRTVVKVGRAHHLRLLGALSKPLDRLMLVGLLQQMGEAESPATFLPQALSESEFRAGLDAEALLAYFQPQVDSHTRQVIGVEALARWKDPVHGILGPAAFIPLAEEAKLIAPLTDQITEYALRQWRSWHDAGHDLTLSINVSMDCLMDLTFPDRLIAKALSNQVPLNRLMIEITESRLTENVAITSDVLTRLCLKRIALSVDDFGTAYSNLEQLQTVPFHELKIDQAFVHGANTNPSTYAILKSSVELAQRLDMQIVAEGVENQDDWDCAASLGIDLIQGFHVARPLPSEHLVSWIRNWH